MYVTTGCVDVIVVTILPELVPEAGSVTVEVTEVTTTEGAVDEGATYVVEGATEVIEVDAGSVVVDGMTDDVVATAEVVDMMEEALLLLLLTADGDVVV